MMPILVSHFTSMNNLKNSDAIHHKTEMKIIFSKGNILFQLQKGAENRTEYVRKQNRELMKTKNRKLIKIAYFLAKSNMAVKQSFEKFAKFFALELAEKLFSIHLSNTPKNATYCTANSVEEYLKVLGEFLDENLKRYFSNEWHDSSRGQNHR